MAKEQQSYPGHWIPDAIPFILVLIIAAHIFALVYWIYRLATQKTTSEEEGALRLLYDSFPKETLVKP